MSAWHGLAILAALPCAMAAVEELAPAAVIQARIQDPALGEASGVVASRRHPGVLWTHNDSGSPAEVFAIDREGRTLARIPVAATNVDWEDIAVDDRGLYLADIGDNARSREGTVVYRVDEPDPAAPPDAPLPVRARWQLRCPPGDTFDSESLVVRGDAGYLFDKRLNGRPGVYRFRLDHDDTPQVLERIAELPFAAPATGADCSEDGQSLAVVTPMGLHVLTLDAPFPDGLAHARDRLLAFFDVHCEACCFVDGAVITISEQRQVRWFSPPRLGRPYPVAAPAPLPRAPRDLRFDGDLGEWRGAGPIVRDGDGLRPRIQAGWAAQGIVFALAAPAGAVAELRVGGDAPGRGPEYRPGDLRCELSVDRDGAATLRWPHGPPDGALCTTKRIDGGWAAEAILPAPTGAGARLRIDAVINGVSLRSQLQPSAAALDAAWSSPLAWAAVVLTEDP